MRNVVIFFIALSALVQGCDDAATDQPEINATSPDSMLVEPLTGPLDSVPGAVESLLNEPVYTSETFENKTAGGWGYRILADGVVYIEQPHIPAVQGNKGFSTQADAEKTAGFAISKMKQGFVPPTLTVQELDSLGVL